MKVAIYTRVSGKSNRQDAANQSLQLIEYCQRQSWDYIEYTDRMTGTRADRAEFQRMFEDARLKHFDLVLFWALDRFSREGTLKTLEYLQRLDSYGVAWKSFTEQYLDSTGMFRDEILFCETVSRLDRDVSGRRNRHPRHDCQAGACAAVGARCCGPTASEARGQGAWSKTNHC